MFSRHRLNNDSCDSSSLSVSPNIRGGVSSSKAHDGTPIFKVDDRVEDRGDTLRTVWTRVVDLYFQLFSRGARKNLRLSQVPVSPGISETKLDRSRGITLAIARRFNENDKSLRMK